MFNSHLHITLLLLLLVSVRHCAANTTKYTFQQQLDHFSKDTELQFPQTVYVNRKHYLPGGPILLYSVGERRAQSVDIKNSWISNLAQQTHAIVVLIELRFFGNSIPAQYNDDMLKYLNIEQMTADIRQFLIHASVVGFVPKQAPWVLIGGSFAGSLMAWTKYQHTIDALVIASSAPMRIVDGFWEFDNMVIKRLPCASQLSSTIRLVDAVLDNKNATNAKQLTHQFGFNSAEDLEQFSTSLVAQVSQLMLESVGSQVLEQIAEFCNYFGKANSIETQTNTIRDNFNHHQSASFGRDKCPQGDELSWFWLQCTELGLWQTAPPVGSNMFGHRLRSRRLSVEYFEIQCKRCLPDSWNILKGQWKQGFRAFSQEAFTRYKSRDLFTVGDLDPWSALAMENTQGHDGAEVLVIKGAAHAEDLRLSEDIDESEENDALGALAVVDARRHIVGMIKKWSADFGNMHMQRTSDAGTSKSTCVVRSFAMVLTLMFVLVM